MNKLKQKLFNLNNLINELENQIEQEKITAKSNINPLKIQLVKSKRIKQDSPPKMISNQSKPAEEKRIILSLKSMPNGTNILF